MDSPTRPCPHCGQPVTPGTIICPYCQSSIVEMQEWNPTGLGPAGIGPGGASPYVARPPGSILWGLLAAQGAAALLIGLGFWLNGVNGTAASVLISSDFLLVPLVMGLLTAFFWRKLALTTMEYFLYALVNSALGLVVAAVFMHEGVICLIIVSPLLLSFVFLGSLAGRWLFGRGDNRLNLSLIPLALALLTWDAMTPHHYENAVSDTLVIHAPPAQVWAHLAAVPPIPDKPGFWLFRMGLPYPTEATVAGQGVGARRRCVFSHNDVFEERITEWQPGHRLTFDVTSQPRDPEILGHARVLRGQFDLRDNGDGTTTLTGTSWYELYVYPSWYYDIWARSIARQVHWRVMRRIQTLSEQKTVEGAADVLAWLFRHVPRLRLVPVLPQLLDTALLAFTLLWRRERIAPREAVERALLSWPGVSTRIHRFGGVEFVVGRREIGHLHGNGLLDIPFTRALRDEAVASGLARPHHIFPRSAWISFYLHSADDVPNALLLLRRNYDRWQALRPGESDTPHVL